MDIVFVVGKQESEKSALCKKLAKEFRYKYLNVDVLLKKDKQFRQKIDECIEQGKNIPISIVVAVLETAIQQAKGNRVIIDGFPSSEFGQWPVDLFPRLVLSLNDEEGKVFENQGVNVVVVDSYDEARPWFVQTLFNGSDIIQAYHRENIARERETTYKMDIEKKVFEKFVAQSKVKCSEYSCIDVPNYFKSFYRRYWQGHGDKILRETRYAQGKDVCKSIWDLKIVDKMEKTDDGNVKDAYEVMLGTSDVEKCEWNWDVFKGKKTEDVVKALSVWYKFSRHMVYFFCERVRVKDKVYPYALTDESDLEMRESGSIRVGVYEQVWSNGNTKYVFAVEVEDVVTKDWFDEIVEMAKKKYLNL